MNKSKAILFIFVLLLFLQDYRSLLASQVSDENVVEIRIRCFPHLADFYFDEHYINGKGELFDAKKGKHRIRASMAGYLTYDQEFDIQENFELEVRLSLLPTSTPRPTQTPTLSPTNSPVPTASPTSSPTKPPIYVEEKDRVPQLSEPIAKESDSAFTFYPDQSEDYVTNSIYTYPTIKEWKISKELWLLFDEFSVDTESERICIEKIAKKYSLSIQDIENINIKFLHYSQFTVKEAKKMPEDLSWEEFYIIVKKVGIPK